MLAGGLPAWNGGIHRAVRKLFALSQWPLFLTAYFLLNFHEVCSFHSTGLFIILPISRCYLSIPHIIHPGVKPRHFLSGHLIIFTWCIFICARFYWKGKKDFLQYHKQFQINIKYLTWSEISPSCQFSSHKGTISHCILSHLSLTSVFHYTPSSLCFLLLL